ncbi:cysteine peptidase family C39 domain-containing protein [Mucisphaera sp.]|uniref:cysteine peptidase family C39 domain-containing protein n=1 Tax=Mucisphaera sp. TaxID=2913024 RepID=UPI003D108876
MDGSIVWFVWLLLISVAGWWVGLWVGRRRPAVSEVVMLVSLGLLGVWGWLMHNPHVSLQAIPVGLLVYLEGVGSVPVFMLLVGAAYARSRGWRQGGVTASAGLLGIVYLFHGGWWMLQSTPEHAFGGAGRSPVVMQTHDYSCVPAACTTTLRLLGVESSEAEMAALTRTRPGSGATLVRAAAGMTEKLAGRAEVLVVALPVEHLRWAPLPAMTALQFEPTRHHMVTLLRVTEHGVWLLDPVDGLVYMTDSMFRLVYREKLLVVDGISAEMRGLARDRIELVIGPGDRDRGWVELAAAGSRGE